jgi:hypothetical protein
MIWRDELSSDNDAPELPPARPEGLAAVRLLQGVVYSEDDRAWQLVLTYRSDLSDYFARIGLLLIVDEPDGLAYLRQLTDEQREAGYEHLPRLLRRVPLSYDLTLLCVLLRDELRRFEDEDLDNERCVVDLESLREVWKSFQPAKHDDVQAKKSLEAAMKKLEQLRFVRQFGETDEYEVRRILKARVPLESLETLRKELVDHVGARNE